MSGEKGNLNPDVLSCTGLRSFLQVYKMAERLLLLVQRMAAEIEGGWTRVRHLLEINLEAGAGSVAEQFFSFCRDGH